MFLNVIFWTFLGLSYINRFFIFGLSTHKITPKTVSLKGLKQLVEFYKENKTEFDQLKRKLGFNYYGKAVSNLCFSLVNEDINALQIHGLEYYIKKIN